MYSYDVQFHFIYLPISIYCRWSCKVIWTVAETHLCFLQHKIYIYLNNPQNPLQVLQLHLYTKIKDNTSPKLHVMNNICPDPGRKLVPRNEPSGVASNNIGADANAYSLFRIAGASGTQHFLLTQAYVGPRPHPTIAPNYSYKTKRNGFWM